MKGAATAGHGDRRGDGSFPIPGLAPWPVPDGSRVVSEVARPLTVYELEKNVASAKEPVFVVNAQGYGAAWPASLERPPAPEMAMTVPHGLQPARHYELRDILLSVLVPPLQFTLVAQVLTFHVHYNHPWLAWILASVGLVPIVMAHLSLKKWNRAWLRFFFYQLLCAFLVATFVSELNFWYCMAPFYSLRAMKTYTEIDPAMVLGQRLMDAGKIHFVDNAKVVTDLAMSFTTWDVYCVAPISTPMGLPSQGSQLASYDFWAVGVGCCQSGTPSFNCGEYNNPAAHSGLRSVDTEQATYFRLAVEQAEAAYGLQARNPVFVYWVSNADSEESLLFEEGFKNWIMACSSHSAMNIVALLINLMAFHEPQRHLSLKW